MATRRDFLMSAMAATLPLMNAEAVTAPTKPLHITIWDERQPAQKTVYSNFLGNEIAEFLKRSGGDDFVVTSVGLDDPDQGLPLSLLNETDVLIWWGHQRHGEVNDALVHEITNRVKSGKLRFIGLHSAHWSKPFTSLMDVRTLELVQASLPKNERGKIEIKVLPGDRRLMTDADRPSPYWDRKKGPDGKEYIEVKLPSCVFTSVEAHGKPSHITTLLPRHPIAKGVLAKFDIPKTELYGGRFFVPQPDAVIFDEKWDAGQTFTAGCYWKVGKGHVFYYRPGHETFAIYKQAENLQIVLNAVRFLGSAR